MISWGFNHARAPYAVHAQLSSDPIEPRDIPVLLTDLIIDCNSLRAQFEVADLELSAGPGGVDPRIAEGYERLGARVPILNSGQPLLRRAFLSPALSAMGISGVYSPFTAEAHLNKQIVPWLQPFVSAHEIDHFKGFAREDEANFIAWQVCRSSPDPAIRYSGTLAAVVHVSRAASRLDPFMASVMFRLMDPEVRRDLEQNRRFWDSASEALLEIPVIEMSITEMAQATNDTYLKSQGQPEGRESYGRMVDLLIAEWSAGSGVGGGD